MQKRDIVEWSGLERIEYCEPTQIVRSFGYEIFMNHYSESTIEHDMKTVESVLKVDGPVATDRSEYADPAAASAAIKHEAGRLGAVMVGVTRLDQRQVYSGHDCTFANVILMAVPMDYDEIKYGATERHVGEVLKIYAAVGQLACNLAAFIRARGYAARAHTLRFEQVNMIPLAIQAGLGELGKHGSLINRELGCSFRLCAVTTDLPLAHDAPRLQGIDEKCANCQMCTKYCPGDAIKPEKEWIRGQMRWLVDTEKCAPYWGSYLACGICLQVCPFNAMADDGKWKQSFVAMIKQTDLPQWRAELKAGLQQAWQYVAEPTEHGPGWRNEVRGTGPGVSTIMLHGIPLSGLPEGVYKQREAMGIRPVKAS